MTEIETDGGVVHIHEEPDEDGTLRCAYRDGRVAKFTVKVENQGILVVCTPCSKELETINKKKRCQYCGVPILDNWMKQALPGFVHQNGCPRLPQ